MLYCATKVKWLFCNFYKTNCAKTNIYWKVLFVIILAAMVFLLSLRLLWQKKGLIHISPADLEAQQRYFSYRAILAAIVSQNSFVLVLVGYCTIIARYVAKWGIAQMCLCETKSQWGVSHHFGGALTSLKKYRAIWGIAGDSITISRDMGPLSPRTGL